jgi:hypothetical protein
MANEDAVRLDLVRLKNESSGVRAIGQYSDAVTKALLDLVARQSYSERIPNAL